MTLPVPLNSTVPGPDLVKFVEVKLPEMVGVLVVPSVTYSMPSVGVPTAPKFRLALIVTPAFAVGVDAVFGLRIRPPLLIARTELTPPERILAAVMAS